MAQSKSFFGLRRGSTKTLTFSVYNGKQVTKDRVANVKNPRSSLQMKQRAIMATALHGYAALKEICDHSFEGVTYGQKSMNYFVAENARMIRTTAPKVNLSTYKGIAVSNAYIIAKGTLDSVTPEVKKIGNDALFTRFVDIGSDYTFGELMNTFGISTPGEMVTFVHLVDNPGSSSSVYWLRMKLTEKNKSIVLNNTGSAPYDVLLKLEQGVDFETNIDNFTSNDFPIALVQNNSDYVLKITAGSPTANPISQSLGIIVSKKSDAGWLRSSSTMVNLFDTFNYAEALTTYPENGEKILNGGNM